VPVRTLAKALLVWAAILALAIVNGAVRDALVAGIVGPTAARAASGIILCTFILVAAFVATPWFGRLQSRSWWGIGMLWLTLTVMFETAVGYAQHQSWHALLDAYTLQGGNLWPAVLGATLVSPWLAARIRGYTWM
jgi:hypothetical protein